MTIDVLQNVTVIIAEQFILLTKNATIMSKAMKRPPAPLTAPMPLEKRPRVAVNISEDVLGIVMEFLSPKQLYRMALTCKALRAAVTTRFV